MLSCGVGWKEISRHESTRHCSRLTDLPKSCWPRVVNLRSCMLWRMTSPLLCSFSRSARGPQSFPSSLDLLSSLSLSLSLPLFLPPSPTLSFWWKPMTRGRVGKALNHAECRDAKKTADGTVLLIQHHMHNFRCQHRSQKNQCRHQHQHRH